MATQVSIEKELRVGTVPLETGTARQGLLVNVAANGAFIAAQAAATLWMTPFFISHLGVAAFGMIPLVTTIASYMSVFTTALDSAVSRFLAIDLGHGNDVAANKTFNTALFGLVGVIIVLAPAVLATSVFFSRMFQVPPGWEGDSNWLFAIVGSSFFVTVLGGMFALSPFIHSRFLLTNIVNLAGLLARIAVIAILFTAFEARLWYAGGGILVGSLVSLLGFVILWRKLTPGLHVRMSEFNPFQLRSLAAMGGWLVVNMLGATLLGRVDLIVVNAYFGPAVTGGYGSVVVFSLLMEYLVTATSTVVRPVMLLKYAQGDLLGLRGVAIQSVKLLGLALALPAGLICGFSRPLLSAWLGPSFAYLSVLLIILISHQSLNLSVRPLLFVQNACNKVRWPGIVTLLSGAANLALAVALAQWGGWGYAGIAVAGAVVWTAKNALYIPVYTSRIMEQPWWALLPSLRWSIVGTIFVGLASYGLALVDTSGSLFTLALSAAVVSLVYAGLVWAIGLDSADRRLLRDLWPFKRAPEPRDPVIVSSRNR